MLFWAWVALWGLTNLSLGSYLAASEQLLAACFLDPVTLCSLLFCVLCLSFFTVESQVIVELEDVLDWDCMPSGILRNFSKVQLA